MPAQPPLFRQQALDYYARSREKSILPRIARPPVFLLLWLLLALAALAVMLAWLGQVPIYLSGPGMIVEQTIVQQQHITHTALALVFLPVTPGQPWRVHVGSQAHIHIGTHGQMLVASVAQVEPGIVGPAEIAQRYAPTDTITAQITGPSIVVLMHLSSAFASETYAGSTLTVQIQVGTTSVLSSVLGTT
jgi:hypothetical protein